MHVQVLVGTQAAAEEDVLLGRGQVAVLEEPFAVRGRVDRVVGLVALLRSTGELAHDDGLLRLVVALRVEMARLDNAGVRDVFVVVVHHRRALEVPDVEHLFFEVDGAPGQIAFGVVEVAVNGSGVNDRDVADDLALAVLVGLIEEVRVEPDLDVGVFGHLLDPRRVAVGRQALVLVVEVPVVVVVAHRKAGDDARGQVLRIRLPLLAGVVLDERLVERAADQLDALVVQVLRIGACELAGLFLDQFLGLPGG